MAFWHEVAGMNAVLTPLSYEVDLVAEDEESRETFVEKYIEQNKDDVRVALTRDYDELYRILKEAFEDGSEENYRALKGFLKCDVAATGQVFSIFCAHLLKERDRIVNEDADKAWKSGEYE